MLAVKREELRRVLLKSQSLLVAYSGGVDSAYLAHMARETLGDRMLAVLADSPSLPRAAMRDAVAFAEEIGLPLRVVDTREMERPEYVKNDSARCFHCKDELFEVMEKIKEELGFAQIAYGMNLDDRADFRPGQKAAEQHGITSPLAYAGLTKADVRELARADGLRIWDKPASACLSSRIEYGRAVTVEALSAVEQGEELLHAMGFRQFRVRHHGEIARIEIGREEMQRALSLDVFDRIVEAFKPLGFKYVSLDMEGYRSGSMNAVLPANSIASAKAAASPR